MVVFCLALMVALAQDGDAGNAVDPVGIPPFSLQITFTGSPLGRKIKKSERNFPFHDSTRFSVFSFLS
jgi:hypothetical protein